MSGTVVVEGGDEGGVQEQAEHAASVAEGAAQVHAERAEAAAAEAAAMAEGVGAAASAAISAADESQIAAASAADSATLVEVSGREILDAINAQTNVLNSALDEFRAGSQRTSTQPPADQATKKTKKRESAPATGRKSARERYFGS